jgi:glycosyltransferase involved in cell wall biosynthesis
MYAKHDGEAQKMSSFPDKIDVCIPTWNSGKTLERCMKSIIREVPVNHIFVLDSFSEDETIGVAEKYNARILQKKCGIGKARQYLIENVATEYFAFIDSDVVLRTGWFNAVMRKMKQDRKVGAVCGLWLTDNAQDQHFWAYWWGRVRPDDPLWGRGFMIDTLIRTEAVRGVSIPEWMNNFEDKFIRKYMTSRGYSWAVVQEILCDHFVSESSFWKTCLGRKYNGAGLRLWKEFDPIWSARKLLSQAPVELIVGSYVAFKVRDPLIIPFKLLGWLFTTIGYLGSSTRLMDEIEKDPDYRRKYSKLRRN